MDGFCTEDVRATMTVEQKTNFEHLDGHSNKDDLVENIVKKKRFRRRKLKSEIREKDRVDITPSLSAVEAVHLQVGSCSTKLQNSESSINAASVALVTTEASGQSSPRKNVTKRAKKAIKSDKSLTNENPSQNTPGPGNNTCKLPQPSPGSSLKNCNGLQSKATSQHSKGDCNKINREDGKSSSPRKKEESNVNEDLFEDYMSPNVVAGLLQLPNYLKGVIRINQKMYTEAYISEPTGKRDILIEGLRNRNRALEGDEVVVAILPESEWKEILPNVKQQTGKVIYLLKAVHPRQAIGMLKPMPQKNSLQALFSPRDSRVPRMRVPIQECPPDFEKNGDHLFLARIIKWENVRFARGSLMGGSIGIQGDIDSETQAILLENQIRCEPYPVDIIPQFPEELEERDLKNREDLRKKCIFSIDPLTARDLDDAMSCECLENGNYLIGVHISDVSFYLKEGTPLDEQVSYTATTTYLVQSVFHMLPKELTMRCSLLPGEDKLSFSVFWELEETETDVKVISHRFTRSVINSCAQLAYEHAQMMLDNPEKKWDTSELPTIYNGFTPENISSVVCNLNRLAKKIRNRRFESGSLRIDQTKLHFVLGEDGLPLDMSVYENNESHRLIEEFMILANVTVATALYERFPKIAFLRQHSPPKSFVMDKLSTQLEESGIIIDTSSSKSLQESLTIYRDDSTIAGAARFIALNSLFSKPMARARYFCSSTAKTEEEVSHFALHVPLYTHFTSPIRRYADVMVHRLLAAYLGYSPTPSWTEDHVISVASNCNGRKYNAKKAGEQSSELFLAVYLKESGPLLGSAVVIDVKDHSFDAIFCSTGTTVRFYADKVGAHVETVQNGRMFNLHLTWIPIDGSKPVQQVISMFSIVNVQLKCSDIKALKIEGVLLPPWEKVGPAKTADSCEEKDNSEPHNIDLSNFQLPDILDDVQECLYTSDDDDLHSPESLSQSPTPSDDDEMKNVTLISKL